MADIANKGLIQGKQQQREPRREGLQEDLTYDDQDTVVLTQGGRSGGSFNEEQLDGIVEELRAKIRRVRRDDPCKARNVVFHLMRYVGRGMKSKLRPLRQASKALADRLEGLMNVHSDYRSQWLRLFWKKLRVAQWLKQPRGQRTSKDNEMEKISWMRSLSGTWSW